MNSAAKGIVAVVLVLGGIAAAASWFLNQGPGEAVGAGSTADARRAAHAAAPETPEAAKSAASRSEEAPDGDPANAAASPSGPVTTYPVAAFLRGLVVDPNGRPIIGAEVTFGRDEPGPFRGGRRGARLISMNEGESIPMARGRTGSDGNFQLERPTRQEGLSLKIDHPDYVLYRRNDLVLPAAGMELGRIALDPGAAVSGQVFGPGGAKVSGAEVSLREVDEEDGIQALFSFGFGSYGERKAVSDHEGRFRISGLPKGKAEVVATMKGLAEGTTAPIELKPLDEVSGLVVQLETGHKVKGVVRDTTGKAVADASVNAIPANGGFRRLVRFARDEPDAKTDSAGRFEIEGLKPGIYEVAAEAKGFARKSVAGIDSAVGAPVEIVLAGSAHIAGHVRFKDSPDPVKDVKVQLFPYWGADFPVPPFDVPDGENLATDDGAFLLQDVEPRSWRVAARGEGTTRALSEVIELAEGASVEGIEIVVERGASVTGRVVDAVSGAPIADADIEAFVENPPPADSPTPAGANVTFTRTVRTRVSPGARMYQGGGERSNVGRTKSDAEGRFTVDHLSAGKYKLDTRHHDHATTRSGEIEVATAQALSGIEIRMGLGGTVEGTVLGIDGAPRGGDRINIESKSVPGVTLNGVSDANGYYRVEHVPAGDAEAKREQGDSGAARTSFRAVTFAIDGANNEPDPGKRFTVPEGESVRVDFSQVEQPYVEGVVTCADGAVAGATVQAISESGGRGPMIFGDNGKKATTGADGHYRIADLEPGKYRIIVRHPQGIVPTRTSIELVAGTPLRQDFFLEGGVVEGTVTAQKDHAKVEGATVSLARVSSAEDPATTMTGNMVFSLAIGGGGAMRTIRFGDDGGETRIATDAEGHFRIPWVPAGKYTVSANRAGFLEAQSIEVEVKPNDHVDGVKVELPPAASLTVKLRSKATGQAMANCPVQLQAEEGGHEFGMTDASGSATFDSLRPGKWTVTGKKDWNSTEEQKSDVTLMAERADELTIDL